MNRGAKMKNDLLLMSVLIVIAILSAILLLQLASSVYSLTDKILLVGIVSPVLVPISIVFWQEAKLRGGYATSIYLTVFVICILVYALVPLPLQNSSLYLPSHP